MALPRDQRVRRSREFAVLRRDGKSWTGRFMTLSVLPAADDDVAAATRFGFTVTKRIGNAVVRNRIRRRLAAITARQASQIVTPHLVVTIARRDAASGGFSALETEWIKLARRVGLLPGATAPPP
jgi:ribonuclease P protein component